MKDYIEYSTTTMLPYVLYNKFIDRTSIPGLNNTDTSILNDIKQFVKDVSSLYPEYELSTTGNKLVDAEYTKYKTHVTNYTNAISNILKNNSYNLSNISLFKEYSNSNSETDSYNIPYAYINFFKQVCKNSFLFAYALLKYSKSSDEGIENVFESTDPFNNDVNEYINKIESFLLNDIAIISKANFNTFVTDLFTKVNDSSDEENENPLGIRLNNINDTIKNNNKYKYLLFVSLLPFIHLMYYYRRVPGRTLNSIDFSERTLENRRKSIHMIYNNCIFTLYTIYELINKHIPYSVNKHLIGDNLNFMMSEIALHSVKNMETEFVTHDALKKEVKASQKRLSNTKTSLEDINLMRSKIVNYINQRDTYNKHAKTYAVLYWIALSLLLIYVIVQTVFFFIKKQAISTYMNMVNIGVMIVVLVLFIVSLF